MEIKGLAKDKSRVNILTEKFYKMKKTHSVSVVLLLIFTFSLTSCSKEDEGFDGSKAAIEDYIGADIVDKMEDFGLQFNTGDNPPDVTGEFYADYLEILNSDVPSDEPGNGIWPQTFRFYDQNGLSVQYSGSGAEQSDEGSGAILTGGDNKFTAILKLKSTYQGYNIESAYVLTGTMSEEGILDYQMAATNLGDDAPDGVVIPEGATRVIHDTDDLAERQ